MTRRHRIAAAYNNAKALLEEFFHRGLFVVAL